MAVVTILSDLGAQENKICHCFTFSPPICHELMGLDAMTLIFLNVSFKPLVAQTVKNLPAMQETLI